MQRLCMIQVLDPRHLTPVIPYQVVKRVVVHFIIGFRSARVLRGVDQVGDFSVEEDLNEHVRVVPILALVELFRGAPNAGEGLILEELVNFGC